MNRKSVAKIRICKFQIFTNRIKRVHELHIQDRISYIAGSERIWFGSFPGTKFVH